MCEEASFDMSKQVVEDIAANVETDKEVVGSSSRGIEFLVEVNMHPVDFKMVLSEDVLQLGFFYNYEWLLSFMNYEMMYKMRMCPTVIHVHEDTVRCIFCCDFELKF